MYSDWESPVSPGRNSTMGALSATSPSGDIQSRPTSPPSNSLNLSFVFNLWNGTSHQTCK